MRTTGPRGRARERRGLTLLELLVALAIGVLFLSVAGGIVGHTADARDALARRARPVAEARSALWLLRDDLAAHRPGSLRIERPAPGAAPVVSLERDAPEPSRVVYRIERERLVRVVHDRFEVGEPARRSVVTAGVRRLDVVALGPEGWRDVWAAPRAPRALAATLDLEGAPSLTVTVTPLAGGTA